MRLFAIGLAAATLAAGLWAGDAKAQVVALGASNVAGLGVGQGAAFPAALERLLQAQGIRARVSNQGVSGDTTGGMLRRLDSAVPNGTRVVVLHPGGNDSSQAERQQNVRQIAARLSSRGIKLINVQPMVRNALQRFAQHDGVHLTVQGHQAVAQALVGPVRQALR